MNTTGHGPNIGHGYSKYVLIGPDGQERPPVIFPSMVASAHSVVSGALARAETVELGGRHYWVGEDSLLGNPLTRIAQDRLGDPVIIPALARGALQRFGHLNGQAAGVCVTGLPASWASDPDKARLLGERLRQATPIYRDIRVIPEPLGLVYSVLLDSAGQVVGDPTLQTGRVGIIDLGHFTDDIAILDRMRPRLESLATYQLGTSRPLQQVRAQLTAAFERDFTLFEVDQAVRAGQVLVRGRPEPLPLHWDAPLQANGVALTTKLVEAWGRATELDAILIGGGGGEVPHKVAAVLAAFPHAYVVPDPQIAVARGYARLARRLALSGAGA